MDRQAALNFVHAKGNLVEQAHLRYLLSGERSEPAIIEQLFSGQREDGGWSPFWASNYSSLDATCFRLAQAEQFGRTADGSPVKSALAFLAQRQREDGSWEEDESMAEQAPPWVTPGDMAARLYLTANCGFWLATRAGWSESVQRAAEYLRKQLDGAGHLPSFLHTHWLVRCGIAYISQRRHRFLTTWNSTYWTCLPATLPG